VGSKKKMSRACQGQIGGQTEQHDVLLMGVFAEGLIAAPVVNRMSPITTVRNSFMGRNLLVVVTTHRF
jgi:hypothetical protein